MSLESLRCSVSFGLLFITPVVSNTWKTCTECILEFNLCVHVMCWKYLFKIAHLCEKKRKSSNFYSKKKKSSKDSVYLLTNTLRCLVSNGGFCLYFYCLGILIPQEIWSAVRTFELLKRSLSKIGCRIHFDLNIWSTVVLLKFRKKKYELWCSKFYFFPLLNKKSLDYEGVKTFQR